MKKLAFKTRLSAFVVICFCFFKPCLVFAATADAKIGSVPFSFVPLHSDDKDIHQTFYGFEVYFAYNASGLASANGGNSPLSPTGEKVIDYSFKSLRHNYNHSGYKQDTRATDRIKIIGHADHFGSAANNRKIALKRARAVRDYILSKGIDFANGVDPKRISIHFRLHAQPTESRCSALPRTDEVKCLYLDRKVEVKYLRE